MDYKSLKCEKCGGQIELYSDRKYGRCIYCGEKVKIEREKKQFCIYCGSSIHKEAFICPVCGRQVEKKPIGKSVLESEKNVLLLLCIFGGFWGLHKFYKGKIFIGIIYFLTGGLFGIGWIVDMFTILTKDKV